jgi:hypothetical protein
MWRHLAIPDEFKNGDYALALSAHLEEAQKLRELLRRPITDDPNDWARLHFIANGFVDTWSRVFFDPTTGRITGNTVSPGDGTVLLFSATNGSPGQVQIALNEHEDVFEGREPELVMTAALSDRRWTKGSDSFDQTFLDAHGVKYVVHSCSLELTPRVTVPGHDIELMIRFQGDEPLTDADLSNLRINLFSNNAVISSIPTDDGPNSPGVRTKRATFHSPNEPGPYGIRLELPGLQSLTAFFAVIRL